MHWNLVSGKVSSIVPVMGVHAHDITSVGVSFSPSGENVGSGDLLGSVWVTRKESIDPLHTCTVSVCVCVCVWSTLWVATITLFTSSHF